MALIVEDGTGLVNAESLCSVADATAYHLKFGNDEWGAIPNETLREAYLRRATAYMEGTYREIWAGFLLTPTQALAWPRYYVPIKGYSPVGISSTSGFGAYYPSNAVPVIVANACAELALRASAGDLAPDIGRQTKREKVDVIEVEYMDGAQPYVRYRAIDNMLRPLLRGSGNGITVLRA